jgi:isopenicillin N synthase-like dioxygenase
MKTSARVFFSAVALLLAVFVLVSLADAQKKKKDQPAPPAHQQATEQAPPTPAPQPIPKATSSFRDYLIQYQGMPTNLGKLVKIAGDYFVVEEDGVQSAHRIDVIHTIRLLKAEEGEPARLELKLLARD